MAEFMRVPDLMERSKRPEDYSVPDPPLAAFNCGECGERYDPNRLQARVERVLAHNRLCHSCQRWTEIWMDREQPGRVFIEGRSYVIADEDAEPKRGPGRGFGGARYKIAFHDGRIVVSTNLWSQGEIPAHFRERLPDNATFCQEYRDEEPDVWL